MRVGVCLGLILAPAASAVGALRQRSRFVVRSAGPAICPARDGVGVVVDGRGRAG